MVQRRYDRRSPQLKGHRALRDVPGHSSPTSRFKHSYIIPAQLTTNRFKHAIIRSKLTHRQVAKRLGVRNSVLHHWLTGGGIAPSYYHPAILGFMDEIDGKDPTNGE